MRHEFNRFKCVQTYLTVFLCVDLLFFSFLCCSINCIRIVVFIITKKKNRKKRKFLFIFYYEMHIIFFRVSQWLSHAMPHFKKHNRYNNQIEMRFSSTFFVFILLCSSFIFLSLLFMEQFILWNKKKNETIFFLW